MQHELLTEREDEQILRFAMEQTSFVYERMVTEIKKLLLGLKDLSSAARVGKNSPETEKAIETLMKSKFNFRPDRSFILLDASNSKINWLVLANSKGSNSVRAYYDPNKNNVGLVVPDLTEALCNINDFAGLDVSADLRNTVQDLVANQAKGATYGVTLDQLDKLIEAATNEFEKAFVTNSQQVKASLYHEFTHKFDKDRVSKQGFNLLSYDSEKRQGLAQKFKDPKANAKTGSEAQAIQANYLKGYHNLTTEVNAIVFQFMPEGLRVFKLTGDIRDGVRRVGQLLGQSHDGMTPKNKQRILKRVYEMMTKISPEQVDMITDRIANSWSNEIKVKSVLFDKMMDYAYNPTNVSQNPNTLEVTFRPVNEFIKTLVISPSQSTSVHSGNIVINLTSLGAGVKLDIFPSLSMQPSKEAVTDKSVLELSSSAFTYLVRNMLVMFLDRILAI